MLLTIFPANRIVLLVLLKARTWIFKLLMSDLSGSSSSSTLTGWSPASWIRVESSRHTPNHASRNKWLGSKLRTFSVKWVILLACRSAFSLHSWTNSSGAMVWLGKDPTCPGVQTPNSSHPEWWYQMWVINSRSRWQLALKVNMFRSSNAKLLGRQSHQPLRSDSRAWKEEASCQGGYASRSW